MSVKSYTYIQLCKIYLTQSVLQFCHLICQCGVLLLYSVTTYTDVSSKIYSYIHCIIEALVKLVCTVFLTCHLEYDCTQISIHSSTFE